MAASDVMSWNPTDPPITIEQMIERDKLVTLDQGREILAATEPLSFVSFSTGDQVRFRVADDWNKELATLPTTAPVEAYVSLGGTEYQLTVDGVQLAASQFSMGQGLVEKSPGHLTEDMLNYWFRTGLNADLQLMVLGEDKIGTAITRDSVQPFSNISLMDKALEVIEGRFPGSSVYVDRNKLSHSLKQTYLQLVLPDVGRLIEGTGEVDDRWWGGLQIANSLTGKGQTEVDGFLFRQRCTNGYIDVQGENRKWSRKTGGQNPEDVMAWAEGAVNEALGHLEGVFDRVQSLVSLRLDPNSVGATANDLFEQYRIPTAARRRVIDNLVETDQLTMYGLTNAVTQAANGAVSPSEQQRLLRAGGDIIQHAERCNGCHRVISDGATH